MESTLNNDMFPAEQATPMDPALKAFPTFPGLPYAKQNPLGIMEYCTFKAAFSGVAGGAMGFVMGSFLGMHEQPNTPAYHAADNWGKMRISMKEMGQKSKGFAKNFALVGVMYSFSECQIERVTGKHEMMNAVAAGCVTGGALAVSAGPQGCVLGCASFAAFSYAIERWMTPEAPPGP